jgi:predicted nuclease of predicted toxin-antitoxin system
VKFLADESVDRQIVDRLRQDDHLVWYVAEMEPGISDDAVLDLANREAALLLTADKDFGELVYRQRRLVPGVVLIRLAGLSPMSKAEVVASAINKRNTELRRAFAVITPGRIRIRRWSTYVVG